MVKQTDYMIVFGSRMMMIDELSKKVKRLQEKGWICQGGFIINPIPSGESSCYQAMIKPVIKKT